MKLQSEFRRIVREQMREQGVSQGELARRMGFARPVVSRYLNGEVTPGADMIEKFLAALGFEPVLEIKEIPSKARAS